jgi:hypothetical protein
VGRWVEAPLDDGERAGFYVTRSMVDEGIREVHELLTNAGNHHDGIKGLVLLAEGSLYYNHGVWEPHDAEMLYKFVAAARQCGLAILMYDLAQKAWWAFRPIPSRRIPHRPTPCRPVPRLSHCVPSRRHLDLFSCLVPPLSSVPSPSKLPKLDAALNHPKAVRWVDHAVEVVGNWSYTPHCSGPDAPRRMRFFPTMRKHGGGTLKVYGPASPAERECARQANPLPQGRLSTRRCAV